jgi:hypothetical protein
MGDLFRRSSRTDKPETQERMVTGGSTNTPANRAKMPERSILSKDFVYENSMNTDVSRTFARIKREQRGKTLAIVKPIRIKP